MGPHLTIAGEDPGPEAGRRVGSCHFAQRASTRLSPVGGHTDDLHSLDSVSPLQLVSPYFQTSPDSSSADHSEGGKETPRILSSILQMARNSLLLVQRTGRVSPRCPGGLSQVAGESQAPLSLPPPPPKEDQVSHLRTRPALASEPMTNTAQASVGGPRRAGRTLEGSS